MDKHSRYGITAEHTDSAMLVTTRISLEDPLSLAAERAAQLYGLLFMVSEYVASGDAFGALKQEIQGGILSLAAGLARETLVLSELAAQHGEGERPLR
ncbi:hypothetical protein CF70_023655 [Cupriavidus sp. SK-3]|uniref:hypothetical protein n=1 Tax=Cupriavidus sp. SK-3 TaxID=1470558 RepID=UPI0004532CA7|nr:hypothetical protein [Cupriavidus sp. SK-3]KDP89124.1 hypothetical protein CF70_023655 [Cupriavidus sp. SK-3]